MAKESPKGQGLSIQELADEALELVAEIARLNLGDEATRKVLASKQGPLNRNIGRVERVAEDLARGHVQALIDQIKSLSED